MLFVRRVLFAEPAFGGESLRTRAVSADVVGYDMSDDHFRFEYFSIARNEVDKDCCFRLLFLKMSNQDNSAAREKHGPQASTKRHNSNQ